MNSLIRFKANLGYPPRFNDLFNALRNLAHVNVSCCYNFKYECCKLGRIGTGYR